MKLIQTVKIFKRSIFKFTAQRAINIRVNETNVGITFINPYGSF